MVASARGGGARVEVCVLVETERSVGVSVAKDVATLAAVMAAGKVVKGALAGRVIADGGLGVRLHLSQKLVDVILLQTW